ncbi:thiamine biosynthesis protein ThiC [Candidatus Methanoperedens nitroreducens]|uniref:Thiamine biosynthesis protein ThiC n=1 Tax=Candidatus Methanoperedens nitratireducens TaxID=1392998 RepID=A0A062V898_9EURY|nr:phosphomethylpyrimidine synthase ThiC [Candidatus Methanoperedens nitroreducens]KCZ71974.1 thiamine biosynthesis protein ThiC [Candidatus Methanoperedens nitroreducens]MDJ1422049.1 phosphomethylpyrimidine synthase ThiC [Candidatus Methanoperedens sp.]
MRTQIEQAKDRAVTPQMEVVAEAEGIDIHVLLSRIAEGSIAIMSRGKKSVGIGRGLATKVNVNIGTSSLRINPDEEVEKARIAERYGADTLTDLSMGGNITGIRKRIFDNTTLPVTTIPIYQAVAEKGLGNMTQEDIVQNIRQQAEEGVSSFVLHCIDSKTLGMLKGGKRIMGMVSKGGSITSAYMLINNCENPFIENFDMILKTLKKYDIVLSLGNTMRSGCIHDTRDRAQLEEIRQNVRLAKRANEEGVQVIIEGMGGHVRADRIAEYVKFHKRCSSFPLFVAGPLPTDVAVGYDHIAGAVGASMAGGAGADYLCYITPSEHLGLPGPEQVKEGLIAFKIAAHIGDSIKYGPNERDMHLAKKRAELDWEGQLNYAIDSERARELAPEEGPCTMCGDFCAIKLMKGFL